MRLNYPELLQTVQLKLSYIVGSLPLAKIAQHSPSIYTSK